MDTLSALTHWGYQENLEELRNQLWTTICELEEARSNAREEIKRRQENINKLVQLLNSANQERDEARNQLQILLNKLTLPNPVELSPAAPFLQPESPQLRQSFTGSEIVSLDTHNNRSHVSSPAVVDSSGNASMSPEFSNVSLADSFGDDAMKLVFDRFVKKPLPEKGRLLEAVIDAGPLLDTIFIAGSLPRWRNPPPLKPLLIPPKPTGGGGTLAPKQNTSLNSSYLLQHCNAGSQAIITSSPMLNKTLMAQSVGKQQCLTAKRKRSQ